MHDYPKLKKRTEVCNVLIIGSGAAGLRAAIAAHEKGKEVMILGKRMKKDAHTVLAAGGINAVLGSRDPDDSWEAHYADTMKEGYYLANTDAVELLVKKSPEAVNELAEWGCPFARTEAGKLDQRYFGAHRWRRTCYAGDWTGRAILHTLVDKAEELDLGIIEHQFIWRLLHENGVCFGALGFDMQTGLITVYQADAVILATGGHTRLWSRSSSRPYENTGDGMALALEAGCALADMELVQFHPTGMTHPPEWAGTLVTEAVRGEGGRLKNALGERFMERYDPKRMELSTRDRVALANYTEIVEGRAGPNGGVFLDVSHLGKEAIIRQLPRMYRQFIEAQLLDISEEPMEVAPTAHYSMGGVVVDPATHATSVQGLFAAGEITSAVHGANRLGGNSLAETLVFGKIVGEEAARYSSSLESQVRSSPKVEEGIAYLEAQIKPGDIFSKQVHRQLRDCMWEHCGVVRTQDSLKRGLSILTELAEKAEDLDVRPSVQGYVDLARALELKAALVCAKATITGALSREESRGAHQREDHPDTKDEFLVNFLIKGQYLDLEVSSSPVQPLPERLLKVIQELGDYELKGRLLE